MWCDFFKLNEIAVTKNALSLFFFITFEIIYLKAFFSDENFSRNLLDFTPGFFFRASTQKPESSAKQGTLNF